MRKSLMTAAVALTPALLLTAACSGGPGGSDGRSAAARASSSAGQTLAGHAPLTEQQLASSLVTDADLPGWAVQQSSSSNGAQTTAPSQFNPDDLAAQGSSGGQGVLRADRPQCEPLADIASTRPAIHRMASVGAAFARQTSGATPDTVNQMLIASHAPGDAQKVMESVKAALGRCVSFNATDGSGRRTPFAVSRGPAVAVGDASVAYVMTDTADKKTGAAMVTVVRTGDTVTSYLSTRSKGGAGAVPLAVARAQDAKLKAALARRP